MLKSLLFNYLGIIMTYGALLIFYSFLSIQYFIYRKKNCVDDSFKGSFATALQFMRKYGYVESMLFFIGAYSTNQKMIATTILMFGSLTVITNIYQKRVLANIKS
ncbi:MAG: hypothetical protein K2Y14_09470 [Burkholderiales bacterium]|nr:hypothetical protein [Burkholderiales bacterium]